MKDRLKSLRREYPETIPVSVGILSAAWKKYRGALDRIVRQYPALFPNLPAERDYDRIECETYRAGTHVDEWGCVWSNIQEGLEAIVTGHPIPRRENIRSFKPPENILEYHPHGFMFLRLFDLRGFEEMMMDFAEEPPELQILIDTVLDHNLRILEKRLKQEPGPVMSFGDDNGMQHALPISPEKWRKYIKPCYQKIFRRCREAGFYVYFHTDGYIWEVIPDMIECGVNILNPQFRANGLKNLIRTCKGKVCVDLDLDRQFFPFATPERIDQHVRQCVEALGDPAGGLWLKAEISFDIPLENIEAIFQALVKYRTFFRPKKK